MSKGTSVQQEVVFVTGASSGIGQGIALHLAKNGYKVYGSSRNTQPDGDFHWLSLDVTDRASIHAGIQEIMQQEGRIDVLINNAGLGMVSAMEEAPLESVQKLMDTNFYGTFWLTQEVLPIMRKQGKGKIFNISSIAGLMGLPYRSVYSASKFAVEGMTEALRSEVDKFGIQVCSIQPGSIRTDIKGGRVSHLPADSPYNPELQHVENTINDEVEAGIRVEDVAIMIDRLIDKNKLQSKYVVAKPFQKLVANPLRRFLPSSIFEKLLWRHYRVK